MSKSKISSVAVVTLAGLLAIPAIAFYVFRTELVLGQRRLSGDPIDVTKYEPAQVVSPFPAIENPAFVTLAEVGERVLPNDLVLGVEINGESRAYPINQLTGPTREIFNDRLGGKSIAATW